MTVSKVIPQDLIASLLTDYEKPEDLIGEHGLLKQLTKRWWSARWKQRWPNILAMPEMRPSPTVTSRNKLGAVSRAI